MLLAMLIFLNASVAYGATTSSFLSEVLSYQVVVSVKRLLVAQSWEKLLRNFGEKFSRLRIT